MISRDASDRLLVATALDATETQAAKVDGAVRMGPSVVVLVLAAMVGAVWVPMDGLR